MSVSETLEDAGSEHEDVESDIEFESDIEEELEHGDPDWSQEFEGSDSEAEDDQNDVSEKRQRNHIR